MLFNRVNFVHVLGVAAGVQFAQSVCLWGVREYAESAHLVPDEDKVGREFLKL